MKMNKILTVVSVMALYGASLEGLGINFGPFDLQLDGGYDADYQPGQTRADMFDNPICRAISQQKKLEFIVESKERSDTKEMKITTKRITVDPYAFGFTKDKQPVLRGTVTEEKLIREVTVKFGEDDDNDDDITVEVKNKNQKEEGSFSGLFRSHKNKDNIESFNLTKVNHMRVIEDSHFDAPKNLESIFKDDIAEVVCQIPAETKN